MLDLWIFLSFKDYQSQNQPVSDKLQGTWAKVMGYHPMTNVSMVRTMKEIRVREAQELRVYRRQMQTTRTVAPL